MKPIIAFILFGNFLWSGVYGVNGYVYNIDNPLVRVDPSEANIEETKGNISRVVDFFLGEYTVAEHYIPARLVAELVYYHGDKVLPDDWWERHKLLTSVSVGFGVGIFINEIWEYYAFESCREDYSSPFERLRSDPDTKTDMMLGFCNLALFASEVMFPSLEGLIYIETHSPIMINYLNPFRSCGWREEVIFSSKFLSFGALQIGIALGHGEPVTEEQKRRGYAPSSFYRVFSPRRMGLEYVPGGPPILGSYCGLSTQYNNKIGKVPFTFNGIIFTSEQRKIAIRTGLTISLNY